MGPVIHAIKLSLSTKKIFFANLLSLLKKIIDYFFYFALTFFTIVKKKIEIAEISAKNQIFTTRFIAECVKKKSFFF